MLLHFCNPACIHNDPEIFTKNPFFSSWVNFYLPIPPLKSPLTLPSSPSKHSSWRRRLEDILRTSFVFFFKRRLQGVCIKTNVFASALRLQKKSPASLQDVLVKTNIFVLAIRPQDIFKTSCKDIFKTFSRHIIKLNCSC